MTTPAETRYRKRYMLARARGLATSYVPAGPVAEHIAQLRAAGVSWTAIAKAADVSPTTIGRIRTGYYPGVQRAVARAITAVTPSTILDRPDPNGLVPAIGSRRRIRALLAIGWRHSDMTARLTVAHRTGVIAHQAGDWVTKATHDAIAALYDELSMTPGPSDLTRQRAAAAGYAPPLAWDDDTIDDPAAQPASGVEVDVDEVAVARAIAGDRTPLNRAERVRVVQRLAARGYSDAEIAARCHVNARTVERDRRAHNIPSTWKADAA
jgi:hypothetical protein